jgi:hypothetical protein
MDKRVKRTRRTKAQMIEARGKSNQDFFASFLSGKRPEEPYVPSMQRVQAPQEDPPVLSPKIRMGWINIYHHEDTSERCWYFTGGDIYPTKELATTHAQKTVIGQVQINYPLKKHCNDL